MGALCFGLHIYDINIPFCHIAILTFQTQSRHFSRVHLSTSLGTSFTLSHRRAESFDKFQSDHTSMLDAGIPTRLCRYLNGNPGHFENLVDTTLAGEIAARRLVRSDSESPTFEALAGCGLLFMSHLCICYQSLCSSFVGSQARNSSSLPSTISTSTLKAC